MATRLPRLADDQLLTPEVGSWGEEKYLLIGNYAQMFAKGMKGKWDTRVYIDLFAGSGRAKLKGTGDIIAGSPLLALGVDVPFDRYVLCEEAADRMDALQKRVTALGTTASARFVAGNVNERITEVLAAIPSPSKDNTILSFCFVDPYKLDNLKFNTIRSLSALYIDFLILIPTFMDANRNEQVYRDTSNKIVDDYLGLADWRERWSKKKAPWEKFGVFVLECYQEQMANLGFKYEPLGQVVEVHSDQKNLPLYHLAFFTRHPRGQDFWEKARKSSDPQGRLFKGAVWRSNPQSNGPTQRGTPSRAALR